MKVKEKAGTTDLSAMLKYLAKDNERLNAKVVSHHGTKLVIRIDDTIQLGVEVDVKQSIRNKGLKKDSIIQISMEDLSIFDATGTAVEIPTEVVKPSTSTRGCSKADREEFKFLRG